MFIVVVVDCCCWWDDGDADEEDEEGDDDDSRLAAEAAAERFGATLVTAPIKLPVIVIATPTINVIINTITIIFNTITIKIVMINPWSSDKRYHQRCLKKAGWKTLKRPSCLKKQRWSRLQSSYTIIIIITHCNHRRKKINFATLLSYETRVNFLPET